MLIKKVVFVLITLFVVNKTWADSYQNEQKNINFIVTSSVVYRYDVFKWSIPDNIFINKKLSELIWKNHIIQPGIKIETKPKVNQFTFLGQVKYGYILKNQSKSWDLDWYNTEKISELHSKSKSIVRGNILDLSGAVGYSLGLVKNSLLTFYLGYDYTDYKNSEYGYRQLIFKRETLPLNHLISKYNFKTQAPWIGLSVNTQLNNRWSIIPTIKFYSFKYVGKGYWLLRDDLKQNPSFKHNAKGYGLGGDVDLIYKYSDNLDFKINLESKKITMRHGRVKTFFSEKERKSALFNIGKKVSDTIKLYDLSLLSSSISFGVRYRI